MDSLQVATSFSGLYSIHDALASSDQLKIKLLPNHACVNHAKLPNYFPFIHLSLEKKVVSPESWGCHLELPALARANESLDHL